MLYAVHVGWKGGHSFYPLMKFEQQEVLTSFESNSDLTTTVLEKVTTTAIK